MRELELMKQNLHYKVSNLENKMLGHSEATMLSLTSKLGEIVFDSGMKMVLNFLFKRKRKKKKHQKGDSE